MDRKKKRVLSIDFLKLTIFSLNFKAEILNIRKRVGVQLKNSRSKASTLLDIIIKKGYIERETFFYEFRSNNTRETKKQA